MYKTSSLSHWRKIFASFFILLPQLFLFELIFKILSVFFFVPAGKELIVMMLEITGDTSLYNYNMLRILLSLPGIAAIVLILCLSAFLAFFEFSVILTGLYRGYRGETFSLKDTVGSSVYSLFSLKFRNIPGLFIYGILLLPFQNIYLIPSVMPHLEIPNFITGELSKRWYGDFVLNLAYILIFLVFLLLLFLLPSMALTGKTFREASENSMYAFLLRKSSGGRLYGDTVLGSPLYPFSGIYGRSCRRLYLFCGRKSLLLSI